VRLRRTSKGNLLVQIPSALPKDTPGTAVYGHPALRLRESATGFVDGPSWPGAARAHPCARPARCAGWSCAVSPRHMGPRGEAARILARRSNGEGVGVGVGVGNGESGDDGVGGRCVDSVAAFTRGEMRSDVWLPQEALPGRGGLDDSAAAASCRTLWTGVSRVGAVVSRRRRGRMAAAWCRAVPRARLPSGRRSRGRG
jgi:hypothetical protein